MIDLFQPKRLFSLIFIVGISVIFTLQFGPGSSGCNAPLTASNSSAAALVNGEEISLRDFNLTYAMQTQYFRSQGQSLPASLAKQIGLPNRVLEQMIDLELLSQAAIQHGLTPSDAELRTQIHKDPNFQVDGKFDFARYQEVLKNYYRKSPPDYEAELRKRLAAGKMLDLVANGASVSDDEVKARYFQQGNKAKATFVRFAPSMFVADVAEPTPAERSAYEASHAKDLQAYYDANKAQFHQPERVRARHILIQVEKSATQADKDAALAKAQKIRGELVAGKDFAAAAKEYSDDKGSKDKGGELGLNERGSWVKEFADAAFSLKPNEISQPVLSPFGYHLIQVEEKKPAEDKTLDQAKDEIAATLIKKDKASALAKAKADQALKGLTSGKALAELYPAPKSDAQDALSRFMTAAAPQATETGEFGEGTDVPQLGQAPELSKAIFAAKTPTALDRVFEVNQGYVVAQVTERTLPTEQAFEAEKDKLREQAIQAKQLELREAYLTSLRKNAKIVTNEEAVNQIADAS